MDVQRYGHTGGAGPGCITIFGLPFFGAGLFVAFLALRQLLEGPAADPQTLFLQAVAALVFGGAGLALIAWGRYLSGRANEAERLKQMHPDAPWMWDPGWSSGRIQGSAKGTMVFSWIFAGFWNLISVPLLILAPQEIEDGNEFAAIGLLFPVIGVGLLGWALLNTSRYRKFGASLFEMKTLPGVIGGPLRGVIHTRLNPTLPRAVRVSLTAVQRRRGRTRNSHSSERVLWQDEQELPAASLYAGAEGLAIPVEFQVPYDSPESDASDPYCQIIWRLEAHAADQGVDYEAQFHIPVFKTRESAPEVDSRPRGASASAFGRASSVPFDPGEATIAMRPHPRGGTEYYFGAGRNRKAAIGLTIFTLIWAGAIWLQVRFEFPVFFPGIFGLFGLLLLLGVLQMWFGTTRVTISPQGVTVTNKTLGIGSSKHLECKDVKAVSLKVGMSQSQSMTQSAKAYWDLQMEPNAGKPFKAGGAIRNKREAEWLAGRMEKEIAGYR